MGRQISIELINGVTVVTYLKDGKTSVQSTAKSRDIVAINGGIQIMPDKDETSFNNEKILISELTDNIGASNGAELVKKFAELGFFKKGGGGVSETDGSCFHVIGNTLKMCNVSTTLNNAVIGQAQPLSSNRIILFIELPELVISNIRLKLKVGHLRPFDFANKTITNVPPIDIEVNTSVFTKADWLAATRKPDVYSFDKVTFSEVTSNVSNHPFNFIGRLNGTDGLDTPEQTINIIQQNYQDTEAPIEVDSGSFNDGRNGLMVYLPKDYIAQHANSMFVNLSDLEITFLEMNNFDQSLYKSFPSIEILDENTIDPFDSAEITILTKPLGGISVLPGGN